MFEFLGGFFDFDSSGIIEAEEAAIGLAMLENLMNENQDSSQTGSVEYSYLFDNDSESDDSVEDRSMELYIAGLDEDELRWIDEDERFLALEDAGLDPFDFDLFDY